MEWEEEDYFSFDSDDDHNPVIRKRRRKESDPPKDGREGHHSSNKKALTSSHTFNSENEISADIVLQREKHPVILKSNSFERDSICRDPSISVNAEINSSKIEEDEESVSRTLEEVGKDVKTELEGNSHILKDLQDVQELKIILFARNANVFYDGENKMQAPLEKVLELAPNLQSLSVYVGDPPEHFRLPIPPKNLPHLTKLSLDSLVGLPRVDYELFEIYFSQLLELKIDANGWRDEYNEAGLFPNLRTLILSGISGNEAHCWKMLKIFHNLNVPSLKVLELRLYHANKMEKYVDVQNTLQIGTAALHKRFEGKWEGRLVGVEGCGCRKLRFSIVSEPEGENDKASDEQKGADDGHQELEREEDFKNTLEVETSGNNESKEDDRRKPVLKALKEIVDGEGTDLVRIVSEITGKDPSKEKTLGSVKISESKENGERIRRILEEVGQDLVKTASAEEDSQISTLKPEIEDLTLILFGKNPMQSNPGNVNVFYDGKYVMEAPLSSFGKVLESAPNLQCLSVYWNPPSEILKPLPNLPHLTSLTFKTFPGMGSAGFAVFQTYFPQLLELQIEDFNCWKDEYNDGHFPNIRTLILGGIDCGNKTHWGKLLKVFEKLKAPSLNILELRLNLPKNLVEIREVKKCLRIGTFALNNRFGNVIGAWDVTQNYFIVLLEKPSF